MPGCPRHPHQCTSRYQLYAVSSALVTSAIADATVGASLVLATAITNESVTVAPDASVAVITTAWFPTSELVGVPVRTPVEAVKVSQLGTVVPVSVTVSPESTSRHMTV